MRGVTPLLSSRWHLFPKASSPEHAITSISVTPMFVLFLCFLSLSVSLVWSIDSAIKLIITDGLPLRVRHLLPTSLPTTTCLSIYVIRGLQYLWSTSTWMGPTVVRPWVQQKSAGYWWPSDLIVPREATATTIRCYAMSMTGNAYYCSVRLISPRSRPALSLRRFGEETNLHLLGSALGFSFRA